MLKGHLYPRYLRTVYDNVHRTYGKSFAMHCHEKPKGYFRLNTFTDYLEKTTENIKTTNALRKSFYIVPLAVDQKKKEFEKQHGFILFSGFWDCR